MHPISPSLGFPAENAHQTKLSIWTRTKKQEGECKHKGIVPNKPFQLSFCMHYVDETLKVCTAKESAEAAMAASLITNAPPPTIPPTPPQTPHCLWPPSLSLSQECLLSWHAPVRPALFPSALFNLALTCFIPPAPAAHWASDSQAPFVVDGSV